jgi:hypothetical protein
MRSRAPYAAQRAALAAWFAGAHGLYNASAGPRLCNAAYRTVLRIAGSTLHGGRDTTKRVFTASCVNVENVHV